MNQKMETGSYTIGEFARSLGLSRRTIDFYTRQGLLHPDQAGSGHGYRRYTEEDRCRVTLIKQLQARKFTLQEIRQALQSSRNPKAASAVGAMERVAIDILGPLPETENHNQYILVIGDYYSYQTTQPRQWLMSW